MVQEEIVVVIFTIKGEQVMNKKFRNQNQVEIDVRTLAKGIYLVKIQSGEGMEVKKLVVE
jgi:LEA14-like dessication related protein